MSEGLVASPRPSEAPPAAPYPDDLQRELQATLSILASIENAYEHERGKLAEWPGPASIKQRLTRELEERHRHDREPHALRLAELHTRIMSLTMFRGLRTRH